MIRTIIIERWPPFRRLLPADVYLWAKAVLLAAVAIQLARLVWVLATPAGPFGEWHPAQARLLPPQAQTAVIASVDPFFRDSGTAAGPAMNLDLKLFGTREDRFAGGGSAVLGPADGEQKSYMVGEEVAPGVRLGAVFFDHVVLDLGGGREQKLFLEQAGAAAVEAAASGDTPGTPGQPSAAMLQQAVRFVPRVQSGRVTGVTISPGSNAAMYASAGFRPGDVVVAVNGARITSQTDVDQLQSSIVPGARLSLMVERGAETVPIALNLAGN